MESESQYRQRIQELYQRIERAFEAVDPDRVECETAMGALTLSFPSQARAVLSAQPSVRQLWLALASRGTAYHFNYDEAQAQWLDDKGRGELIELLQKHLEEITGLSILL